MKKGNGIQITRMKSETNHCVTAIKTRRQKNKSEGLKANLRTWIADKRCFTHVSRLDFHFWPPNKQMTLHLVNFTFKCASQYRTVSTKPVLFYGRPNSIPCLHNKKHKKCSNYTTRLYKLYLLYNSSEHFYYNNKNAV